MKSNQEWFSQLWTQFQTQLRKMAEKNSRLQGRYPRPAFLRNCINCVHNCENHSSFDFISVVLIQDLNLTTDILLTRGFVRSTKSFFRGHKIVPVIKRCSRFCCLTWLMKMKKRCEIAKKPCLVLKALLKKNAALSHSFGNKKLS